MNSSDADSPSLSVQQETLSTTDIDAIRASCYREAKSEVGCAFTLAAGIATSAIYGILEYLRLAWGIENYWLIGVVIGAVLVLAAAGFALAIWFCDYRSIRQDLQSGDCEVLTVVASRATRVLLHNEKSRQRRRMS